MKSELRELRQMVVEAHDNSGRGDDEEYFRFVTSFFERTAKESGISLEKRIPIKNDLKVHRAFIEHLYNTRLIHPTRADSDTASSTALDKETLEEYERFLIDWYSAIINNLDTALVQKLRAMIGTEAGATDLYQMTATAFVLLLQNARANWLSVYQSPFKKLILDELKEIKKDSLKFPAASQTWDKSNIKNIPKEILEKCWNKLPEDNSLRQAIEFDEDKLRWLLSLSDTIAVNDYLEMARRFIIKKGEEMDPESLEHIKLPLKRASVSKENFNAIVDGVEIFLFYWGDGFLDAPDATNRMQKKKSKDHVFTPKLPYRTLRYLFFILLGDDDPLYGTPQDQRDLLIRLGFAIGLNSAEIDQLLKERGLAGLDFKNYELIYAYAADHFEPDDPNRYLHAEAFQRIYEMECTSKRLFATVIPEEDALSPLKEKETVFFRSMYSAGNWKDKTPSDFLEECYKAGIAYRRTLSTGKKHEEAEHPETKSTSSKDLVIHSSQLFELRKILIELEHASQDVPAESDEQNFKNMKSAWENREKSLNDGTDDFDDFSEGWTEFIKWGRDGEIKRHTVSKHTIDRFSNYFPYGGSTDKNAALKDAVAQAFQAIWSGNWITRDDFVRLLFLEFLVTYKERHRDPPTNASDMLTTFANDSIRQLERCRLLPYTVDDDMLTASLSCAAQNYLDSLKK